MNRVLEWGPWLYFELFSCYWGRIGVALLYWRQTVVGSPLIIFSLPTGPGSIIISSPLHLNCQGGTLFHFLRRKLGDKESSLSSRDGQEEGKGRDRKSRTVFQEYDAVLKKVMYTGVSWNWYLDDTIFLPCNSERLTMFTVVSVMQEIMLLF